MRRNPPAKWVLPEVVDPPRICFQIEVPNDRQHLAAFRGAILNLAAAYKWQDDPDHTAKRVAAVWDDIYTKIRTCEPDNSGNLGVWIEDFMTTGFRVDPDNNCILQTWCIDHWETFWDISPCVAQNATQPSPGTPIEPGECRTYHVTLQANSKWLLPQAVSPGMTVEVTNTQGGWSDGTVEWFCPNGQTFVGNACVGGGGGAEAGDPLQLVDHMRLIAQVGSNYFDAYNTQIPVTGGTSDVFFQANDGTLADNQGSISFDVTVCNTEASGEWTFRALGGWGNHLKLTPYNFEGCVDAYNATDDSYEGCDPGDGALRLGVRAVVPSATNITYVQIVIDLDKTDNVLTRPASLFFDAATIEDWFVTDAGVYRKVFTWIGSATINSYVQVNGGLGAAAYACTYWEIRGTGVNPFA